MLKGKFFKLEYFAGKTIICSELFESLKTLPKYDAVAKTVGTNFLAYEPDTESVVLSITNIKETNKHVISEKGEPETVCLKEAEMCCFHITKDFVFASKSNSALLLGLEYISTFIKNEAEIKAVEVKTATMQNIMENMESVSYVSVESMNTDTGTKERISLKGKTIVIEDIPIGAIKAANGVFSFSLFDKPKLIKIKNNGAISMKFAEDVAPVCVMNIVFNLLK